ncbi:MAG: cupin domain-containing protein [Dehalococcoidia bacterium]|nr:MAG: cupin domain-containing protein [Dehalococcoidia bacterium]
MKAKIMRVEELPIYLGDVFRTRILVDEEVGSKHVAVFYVEQAPGTHGAEHVRDNEEINFVLRGHPVLEIIGEGEYHLIPGMVAFIPPGVKHRHINTGEEAVLMIGIRAPISDAAQKVKLRPKEVPRK